jgi:hypothetical protein
MKLSMGCFAGVLRDVELTGGAYPGAALHARARPPLCGPEIFMPPCAAHPSCARKKKHQGKEQRRRRRGRRRMRRRRKCEITISARRRAGIPSTSLVHRHPTVAEAELQPPGRSRLVATASSIAVLPPLAGDQIFVAHTGATADNARVDCNVSAPFRAVTPYSPIQPLAQAQAQVR